jgi:hypothetical protein
MSDDQFETHIKSTAWYGVLSQAANDDDDGASVFRMTRMAAREAWNASQVLIEQQAARIAELEAQTKPAMMWTLIGQGLPTEPGDYLVMLEPDNEWEIRSTAPIMVEFDAFTSMPKAFTYHDGWHTEHQNITASVTAYMCAPAGPAALLKGGTAQ